MTQSVRPVKRLAADHIAQEAFLRLVPWVENHAAVQFRHLRPVEKEEATASAVGHAFVSFLTLRSRGKNPFHFPSAIASYSVLAAMSGRRVEGGATSRDALDPVSRRRREHRVVEFSQCPGAWWRDLLAGDRGTVADQAAFNLDFPVWRASLSPIKRGTADLLAQGHSTSTVARLLGVCPPRISQIRRELAASWYAFHGETR